MDSIEKRIVQDGKTTYRVKIRLKGYPTQTATFHRVTDAKRWVQDTESSIREGRHFKTSEAKKHTLSELIDRYCRDVLPDKKSGKDQLRQLDWWKSEIGDYVLSDITAAIIVERPG